MLKKARDNAEREGLENLTFVRGDAENLPFENQVSDGITCVASLYLFPDREKALCEMKRGLKEDSKLVLCEGVKPEKPNLILRGWLRYIGYCDENMYTKIRERMKEKVTLVNIDELKQMFNRLDVAFMFFE